MRSEKSEGRAMAFLPLFGVKTLSDKNGMAMAIVRSPGSGEWHKTEFGIGHFSICTPRTREELPRRK
jgi:hypothetical protein